MDSGKQPRQDVRRLAAVAADSAEGLSHTEVAAGASQFAERLRAAGMRVGEVVALLTRASPRAFAAYWAALRSGFTVVPIDCGLSLEAVAYVINDSGARVLVASADEADLAAAVRPLTPRVEWRLTFGGPIAGHEGYEPTVPALRGDRLVERWGSDKLYTAGVTGRPRATDRGPGALDEYRRQLRHLLTGECAVDSETVCLFAHSFADALAIQVAGVVHAAGGTIVTLARLEPESVLATVEGRRATMVHVDPVTLVGMLKLPETVRSRYDLSSLRAVLVSSAPCPSEAKRRAIAWWGPIVHEIYSCAERIGLTFLDARDVPSKENSVGRSMLGPVHICGPDGAELPAGVTGRIYFERSARPDVGQDTLVTTAIERHPYHSNWSTAGDLGSLDDEGFLYLADRESFLIQSGGYWVYPREVEDVLVMHPGVADVAAIGIEDETYGQQVKTVVKVAPGAVAGKELERELVELARASLGRWQLPRSVDFADEIPRTESGKLAKRELMRRYALADSVPT